MYMQQQRKKIALAPVKCQKLEMWLHFNQLRGNAQAGVRSVQSSLNYWSSVRSIILTILPNGIRIQLR